MAKQNNLVIWVLGAFIIYFLVSGAPSTTPQPLDENSVKISQKNPDAYSFQGVGKVSTLLDYTKPVDVTAANWRVKIGKQTTPYQDLAIPQSCFDYNESVILLKVDAWSDYNTGEYSAASCFDGAWKVLTKQTGPRCGIDGDSTCADASICTYVPGARAFDNDYSTGISSYTNCNQGQNFYAFDNAGVFWDEELFWIVPKSSPAACHIIYRSNLPNDIQCETILASADSYWVVAEVDGVLKSFGYSGCFNYGSAQEELGYKDGFGRKLEISSSGSVYTLEVIDGASRLKFKSDITSSAVDSLLPKEPFTKNFQEVYASSGVSCPLLWKDVGAYCTVGHDCRSNECVSNKCE